MENSIYFDKHFEKFINNDISIRHYFKCKVAELKRDYPTIFTSIRKTTGIKLVNNEPETINKAKEILYNVYLLKQSPGQGRTLSDNFKVLKDDKLVEIMKDRSLTFGERCEKVNRILILNSAGVIVKGVKENENQLKSENFLEPKALTYKQIEQYIYRNYSDYKYIKVNLVPESESQSEETKIIPESSEESQEVMKYGNVNEPKEQLNDNESEPKQKPVKDWKNEQPKTKGKFKEFKTDEIVNIINNNTSKAAFKILYERFKDKYTETQIRNYIARAKAKGF